MTTAESRLDAKRFTPSFTVNDVERSVRFYEGLGLAVEERWEEGGKLLGVMLKAGAGRLGLSQDDWAKGRDRVKGLGVRLWLETDQDIDDLAAKARAAGVVLDEGPVTTEGGARTFGVTDPDGFKLTISHDG